MKKQTWILLILIGLCLGAYYGYQTYDRDRTDSLPPVITISEEALQVSVLDDESALLQGITAQDDVDGDVTGSVLVETKELESADGTLSVTYAAFDRSGNVAKAVRQVRYTDYTGPRFELDHPLIFTYGSGFDLLEEIRVIDQLDGDITHWVRATSLDETSVAYEGSHSVKFRVTNTLGDTVELILPVEVTAAGTYEAEVTLTDYLIYMDAGTRFLPKDYLDLFVCNGEEISLKGNIPGSCKLEITSTVDPETPGTYWVDYLVTCTDGTDPDNSRSYVGFSRLIVVVEG